MIAEFDKSWARGEEATKASPSLSLSWVEVEYDVVPLSDTECNQTGRNFKSQTVVFCCGKTFSLSFKGIKCCPISVTFPENIIIKGFQLQQTFKCSEIFSFFSCVDAIETKSFYKEGFLFWYAAQVTLNAKRLWALQLPWKRRVSARISKSKNYLRLRTKRQIPSTFVRPTLTPLRHAFYRVLQIFQWGCFWSFFCRLW